MDSNATNNKVLDYHKALKLSKEVNIDESAWYSFRLYEF